MPDQPISRFPVPSLDSLPEDVRARILAVQEKAGFISRTSSRLCWPRRCWPSTTA